MIIIPGTSLPALSNPGAAGDLKNGKQLIDANGNVLTGTMPSISLPTPGITVSSGGLITASYEADAGYTSGGSKSATKQLTTQAGTTITPGSSQKTAVASGRYTTGPVYVAGDSDLKASNIKDGVNIFGVTGNYTGNYNDYRVNLKFETDTTLNRVSTSGYFYYYRAYYTATRPDPPRGSWDLVGITLILNPSNSGTNYVTYVATGTLASRLYDGNTMGASKPPKNITNTYLDFGIMDSTMSNYGSIKIIDGYVVFNCG